MSTSPPPLSPCGCNPDVFSLDTCCRPANFNFNAGHTVDELNQRFRACPHKTKYLVFRVCELIYPTPETTKEYNEKSRNLFDMDAIKEECKQNVGNYQMTDEEWELVKANFAYQDVANRANKAYSKEYIINALSRLTDYVAEQDPTSIVFVFKNTHPTLRVKKDVFLEYLNLFKKVFPKWYNLPPMLADDLQNFLSNLFDWRMPFWRQLKMQYEEQFNANTADSVDSELHEHPYKWMRAIRHFLGKVSGTCDADEYEFFRTSTEPRLQLSVKEYCYLSWECEEWVFLVDDPDENEAITAMFDVFKLNPEVDPDAEGFSPENAEQGIVAVVNLIEENTITPRDHIVDSWYLAKLRWLFDATKRKLSRPAQKVVFHLLWEQASKMNADIYGAIPEELNFEQPLRRHQGFIALCQAIRDYGTFAGLTSQCLPMNIETAIFQPPSNADAFQDLENLRVIKGLDDDNEQFLQLRGLIENTANQLTRDEEEHTFGTICEIILQGEWFTNQANGLTLGFPEALMEFLDDYAEFIRDLEFCLEDLIFDPLQVPAPLPSMQDVINSGVLRVAPMWKFYGLDKKHRREDKRGEHLECVLCKEAPLKEDIIPHMVKIVECKCHNVFHLACFKSMLAHCGSKCPLCETPIKKFNLDTDPTDLKEQSNWSDFFHELAINPDDTSEDITSYAFRDFKMVKFIEAHVNKSPANPDSSTVSMRELLLRYRTFAKEQNLPFLYSKVDKALKREMVVQFGQPTFGFPSFVWSGIVLTPSVAENAGGGAGAGAGAPSIFVQTETQAETFAKLAELDAEYFAEQIAKLDDEIFQFANEESATEEPALTLRVRAVKKGIDPRTFSPLRERFDKLYDLATPELEGFAKTTPDPDPWGSIARNILRYRCEPCDDDIKIKEALFWALEGFCKCEDKRFEALVGGGGAEEKTDASAGAGAGADQETGDGAGASEGADEDVKNDEAGAGVGVFELEGGANGALFNLLVQATESNGCSGTHPPPF